MLTFIGRVIWFWWVKSALLIFLTLVAQLSRISARCCIEVGFLAVSARFPDSDNVGRMCGGAVDDDILDARPGWNKKINIKGEQENEFWWMNATNSSNVTQWSGGSKIWQMECGWLFLKRYTKMKNNHEVNICVSLCRYMQVTWFVIERGDLSSCPKVVRDPVIFEFRYLSDPSGTSTHLVLTCNQVLRVNSI